MKEMAKEQHPFHIAEGLQSLPETRICLSLLTAIDSINFDYEFITQLVISDSLKWNIELAKTWITPLHLVESSSD